MSLRLVVATKNPDKRIEVYDILSKWVDVEIVEGAEWPDVDETESTLAGNALLKARAAAEATGEIAVADDTGLEVDVLDGRPGVHSARYSGPGATYESNRRKLLAELSGSTDRAARFRTAVAMVDPARPDDPVVVEGVLEGVITEAERGTGGFGYDSIFEVDGRTLAEMSDVDKNQISHRYRALTALAKAVEEATR